MYFKTPLNPCPTVQRTKTGFLLFCILSCIFTVLIMQMCVSVCEYMPLSGGSHRGQKRATDSLEPELQSVVNCLMQMLGIKLRPLEEQYLLLTAEFSL